MRRRILLPLFVSVTLATAMPAAAQRPYTELDFPPLRAIEVPEVERVELDNGLTLYLLEDHDLPKVEGMALVRTGSRVEPVEQAGLASLLGQVLRTGGSAARSGEEIDRLLENTGSVVETSIGTTSGRVSLFALTEHLPLAIEILAEILMSPALPEDKIELAKVQERTAIARRNDDVSAIASREFRKLVYGEDSPYARTTEYASIASVTREDLAAFHRRYFVPNRTLLGLWGDFDAAEVRALVERHFGSWERGGPGAEPTPIAPPRGGGGVYFVEKADVNQTSLRIGHLGGRFDDPDYFALDVMAEILGGGFSSRLFQTVRAQRGLAYGASASWASAYDYDGTFAVSSSTKSESTVETVRAIVEEIERMASEPVSEEELAQAKDGILNSFVFNFDTGGEVVRRLLTYDYYGYPRDFLTAFQKNVERVTVADVARAAREHLRPEDLVVLAVGREEDFGTPLDALGPVRRVDVAIPPPPVAEAPEASPETLAAGAEVLRRFVASAPALRGFAIEGESVLTTPQGELPASFAILFAGPDRYREATRLPFGEIVTVVDGDAAWASTPRGVRDLDADQARRTREGVFRHYPGLLWAAANGRVEAQLLGARPGFSEVRLRIGELDMRGLFEEATGRLTELTLAGTSLEGAPVEEKRVFSAFEEGLPRRVEIAQDETPAARTTIRSLRLDPEVDEALFRRP